MTAWEILEGNSTAPSGSTAWVHLNNQAGGGDPVIIPTIHELEIYQPTIEPLIILDYEG